MSEALVQDRYVIVHRRMLRQLSRLRVPAAVAAKLLPVVAAWVIDYVKADERDMLEPTLWALRWLADSIKDDAQAVGWYRVALTYLGECGPHDRLRLLTAWWPDELRDHLAWTQAAVATAASPELVDYYNQRREPLLAALFDRPQLLTGIPLAEIQPLSDVHGTRYVWRTLEPVELLQAAGRWTDGAAVARGIEAGQPAGEEGGPGRRLAGAIARAAELAQLLADGPAPIAALREHAEAVRSAITLLESSIPDRARDEHLRSLLDGLLAFATSAELLLEPVVADPAAGAAEVDRAAGVLAATPSAHASGEQRQRVAGGWRIAALLLRYDNAVRGAAPDTHGVLQAAKRQADVLLATIAAADPVPESTRSASS